MNPLHDKHGLTIPEAARMLDTSEYQIRKLVKSGDLEVLRKYEGKHRPMLVSREDAKWWIRRNAYRAYDDRFRMVCTLGASSIAIVALIAGNLVVREARSVLEAVNTTHTDDTPIIIICRDLSTEEENLLRLYNDRIDVIWHRDDTELRWLVRSTLIRVERRIAQVY